MFSKAPTIVSSASPSLTALLVMIGFRIALENGHGHLFDADELPLVIHLINTAIAAEPRFVSWKSFMNLSYAEQQAFFNRNITTGFDAHKAARKLMIKNKIESAIENKKIEQLVFLSGGYDHRSYMLAKKYPHIQIFELDRGETRKIKINGLKTIPSATETVKEEAGHFCINQNLHLVECDFLSHDLRTQLKSFGYDPAKRTLFIAEGLTMYLTQENNQELLDRLFDLLHEGEEVLLSYRLSKVLATPLAAQLHASSNEPYLFALSPSGVPAFANAKGFAVSGKMLCADLLDWVHCHQDEPKGDSYYLLQRSAAVREQKRQTEMDIDRIALISDKSLPGPDTRSNYRKIA